MRGSDNGIEVIEERQSEEDFTSLKKRGGTFTRNTSLGKGQST